MEHFHAAAGSVMTAHHRIAGTGLFALDVIVDCDGHVAKTALGGSAGNVLSILAAFGWAAVPIGTLGDDKAGRAVHREFSDLGADLALMRFSSERSTPVVYQHQMRSQTCTHRFSFACPECGRRRPPSWDDDSDLGQSPDDLPCADVFFLDRPTQLGVALARRYAGQGALVVFEPSAIGDDEELFAAALRSSHIVKYADERMGEVAGFELQPNAIEIQTRGAKGLRFRAPALCDSWLVLGAYDLPHLVDTAGAGDWCTAGLIYDLLSRRTVRKENWNVEIVMRSLAFGQALSTLNCLTEGARGLLEVWTPSEIIRSARVLTSIRVRAFAENRIQPWRSVCDPKLEELAKHVRLLDDRPRLNANNFSCCL